jgi:hypothetical protein
MAAASARMAGVDRSAGEVEHVRGPQLGQQQFM